MVRANNLLSLLSIGCSMASIGHAFMTLPHGLVGTRIESPSWERFNPRAADTTLNLFWFQGKDSKKKNTESSEKRPGMEGVVTAMDSMDSFKKSQKVGKMTESIVQELSSLVIEGVAADGKVRVFFDGQQRPKGVDIDETYLAETSGRDLCSALTAAMQDAHRKSSEKMEDKMRAFYGELGLPSSS